MGADLFSLLCEMDTRKQSKMYFLKTAQGVTIKTEENLIKHCPSLQVVGTYHLSYGFEKDEEETNKIIAIIRKNIFCIY